VYQVRAWDVVLLIDLRFYYFDMRLGCFGTLGQHFSRSIFFLKKNLLYEKKLQERMAKAEALEAKGNIHFGDGDMEQAIVRVI